MSARIVRPSALTMPAVTVCWNPYGLPMATAIWPTRTPALSASRTCGSGSVAGSTRITARSVSGSVPTTRAGSARASCSVTSSSRAPRTTWLFVRMNPSGAMTKPEPLPWPRSPASTRMFTTLGATRLTTAATVCE